MTFKNLLILNANAIPCNILFLYIVLFAGFSFASCEDNVMPGRGDTTGDTRSSDNPLISHPNDSSIPKPQILSWSLCGNYSAKKYDVYLSKDSPHFSLRPVSIDNVDTAVSIWNLEIGARYFWRIDIKDNAAVVRTTGTFSFFSPLLWPRMIYIDGVTNVRDIGGMVNKDGFMVRQGLYYRSGEFNDYNNITDLGIRQIMDLGIVCEIDLRYDSESAHAVLPSSVKYFRPYNSSGEGGLAPYQYGLRNYADQYRDVFKVMADSSNFPMVCHCIAGADRTGTVTALLEALLGCTEHEMAVDYQWTSLSVWGIRDTAGSDWKGLMSEIKSYDRKNGTVQAGAWYYLLSKGLSVSGLKSIRKIFLNDTIQPYPDTPEVIEGKKIIVNYATRAKCFLYNNRCFTVGPETRRIDIFDLSGKRIWKFERPFTGNELKVQLPKYARGMFIMYCVNEKTN